ncbi:MAG: trypsin-like peptidase domain-containing protein [Dehalococcoidia bacterium]|nr:trypsin-like peptidase domain-containing protein [Dehalococcoidia bacterium]
MSTVLPDLSEALADAVDLAAGGLVRVEGRDRLPATGIVWDGDGLIITSHHVLERDENIIVGFGDGESATAELVGRDPATDLALLRTAKRGQTMPAWAEPDDLRVGHLALALGRPGANPRATMGIISAIGKSWRTPAGGQIDRFLQTDIVMYPGFSGGPLVDSQGRFVGLNSSALVRGVSVTVSAPTLRRVVGELVEHGSVRRAYLGVGSQPTRIPDALAKELGQETGLLLVSVSPESAAEAGGLFLGDTLVSLADSPLRHMDDLFNGLDGDKIGKPLNVRIIRGGQLLEVTVTPSAHS